MILWAKVEDRANGQALVAFRRELVQTPRGVMLDDAPVVVVEGLSGIDGWHGKGVAVEAQVSRPGESIACSIQIALSNELPKDPVIPRAKFSDPKAPAQAPGAPAPAPQVGKVNRGGGWKATVKPRPAPVPGARPQKGGVNRGGGRGR